MNDVAQAVKSRQWIRRAASLLSLLLLMAGAPACSSVFRSGPETDSWRLIESNLLSDSQTSTFSATLLMRTTAVFVAIGQAKSGAVNVWHSADGEKWSLSDSQAFQPPPGSQYDIRHIVKLGDGALAIGGEVELQSGSFIRMLSWVSPDGISWNRDKLFPEQSRGPFLGFGGIASDGKEVYFYDALYGFLRRNAAGSWRYFTLPTDCRTSIELGGYTDLGATFLGFNSTEISIGNFFIEGATICGARSSGEVRKYGNRTVLGIAEAAASLADTTVVVGYTVGPDGEELSPPTSTRTHDGGMTWSDPLMLPVPDGLSETTIVRAVSAIDDLLVATGAAIGEGSIEIPVIWVSSDEGESWVVQQLPALGINGWISDVASHEGRIVILAQYGYGPIETPGLIVNF